MFCPKCSAYLSERELIKTDVKYAPGNIPIEYDARCPQCRVEMGRVSWGQLTVNPELAQDAEKTDDGKAKAKVCPHCGKELPENL